MYTFIVISSPSPEILANASSCDPVMALETQYVFNREVWLDLGNHPTEALAAQGARSPSSQTSGRWSRSCGMIGVTSTFFYSISFSSSSIANWVHLRRTRTFSFPKETGAQWEYTAHGRRISRTQQWRQALIAVPWCTLVSGPDDPSTGGVAPWRQDPDYAKRLYNLSDRVCPSTNDESLMASFSKMGATPFCG